MEMTNMYDFLQTYDQIRLSGRYTISSFLRLYRIVNDLGMGEQQIIKVLEIANHNQLEYLQGKVEYLSNEVKMLEEEKANCTNERVQNSHATLRELNNQITQASNVAEHYRTSCRQERMKLGCLEQQRNKQVALVKNFQDTNEQHIKITKIVDPG